MNPLENNAAYLIDSEGLVIGLLKQVTFTQETKQVESGFRDGVRAQWPGGHRLRQSASLHWSGIIVGAKPLNLPDSKVQLLGSVGVWGRPTGYALFRTCVIMSFGWYGDTLTVLGVALPNENGVLYELLDELPDLKYGDSVPLETTPSYFPVDDIVWNVGSNSGTLGGKQVTKEQVYVEKNPSSAYADLTELLKLKQKELLKLKQQKEFFKKELSTDKSKEKPKAPSITLGGRRPVDFDED